MSKISELTILQKKLTVKKGKLNKFGGYSYRTCEDILEEVKKHIKDSCVLTLTDEPILIGDRFYIKAKAGFYDGDEVPPTICHGYARECQTKKGMDEAQVTGAASSYARKYALCGLFLIDGGDDPDAKDNTKEERKKVKKEPREIEGELYGRISTFFEGLEGTDDETHKKIIKWELYLEKFMYSDSMIKQNINTHFTTLKSTFMSNQEAGDGF